MRRPLAAVLAVLALAAPAPASAATTAPAGDDPAIAAHTVPAWWSDAKLGIFIHWGPYSVPAWGPVTDAEKSSNFTPYAEWYGQTMTIPGTATWQHHLRTYGPDVGYDDFITMWKAQHFDPDAWIRLFERAGAKYFVLTTKHHDGFALWCSKTSRRNACDMGPHRDLVGDLMAASHRAGDRVRPGLYYSIPEWFNPAPKGPFLYTENPRWDGGTRLAFSVSFENPLPRRNPYTQLPIPYTGYVPIGDYTTGQVHPQMEELIRQFHPAVLWCDLGGRESYFHINPVLRDYYAAVPDGVVNDRCGDQHTHADYTTVELPTDTAEPPFEVVQGLAGLGSSFGYNAAEPDSQYQTVPELIDTLVDTVARGGNLMLDIGPRADGSIPEVMSDRLEGLGRWLAVNGEAIYGSRPFTPHAAGSVRFTVGPAGFLYATVLGDPVRQVRIDAPLPPAADTRVALLGDDATPLASRRDGDALVVDLPPSAGHAPVLRIGAPLAPTLTARRRGRTVTGRLVLPRGVTPAMGCRGTVRVGPHRARLRSTCRFTTRARRAATARFTGNPVLRAARAPLR